MSPIAAVIFIFTEHLLGNQKRAIRCTYLFETGKAVKKLHKLHASVVLSAFNYRGH